MMSFETKGLRNFILLHAGRLLFFSSIGGVSLCVCHLLDQESPVLKTILAGAALSGAAYPSFKNLWKEFSSTQEVLWILSLILFSYMFCCFADAFDLVRNSFSVRLSRFSWQLLFIAWGVMEFYVCRLKRTLCIERGSHDE
jgi:hypothetical protein